MCGICLVIDGITSAVRRELFLRLCPNFIHSEGQKTIRYDNSEDLLQRCLSQVERRGPTVPNGYASWIVGSHGEGLRGAASSGECQARSHEEVHRPESDGRIVNSVLKLQMHASVLHLRGALPTPQPLQLSLDPSHSEPSSSPSICVVWNGEVFGGCMYAECAPSANTNSDTQVLGQRLLDIYCRYRNQSNDALRDLEDETLSLLDDIEGPFATIIYFGPPIHQLWIARDKLGRRSLCLIDPSPERPYASLIVSSVGPSPSLQCAMERMVPYMGEIGVRGVAVVTLDGLLHDEKRQRGVVDPSCLESVVRILNWKTPVRFSTNHFWTSPFATSVLDMESELLIALEAILLNSIKKRLEIPNAQSIALLFSGGVDSAILLTLILKVLPSSTKLDLLNVAFGEPLEAPDRFTCLSTYEEIHSATFDSAFSITTSTPLRLNLVCIDISKDDIKSHELQICSLLQSKNAHMDFNIGVSLYFASRGVGFLVRPDFKTNENSEWWTAFLDRYLPPNVEKRRLDPFSDQLAEPALIEPCTNCNLVKKKGCTYDRCRLCCDKRRREDFQSHHCKVHHHPHAAPHLLPLPLEALRPPCCLYQSAMETENVSPSRCTCRQSCPSFLSQYRSDSPIVFTGHGADELFGGYGRHATASRVGGSEGARIEMIKDLSRLWDRNLGRDDRCVACWGKEPRYPFLDEEVIQFIGDLPFEVLRSPNEDKPLLRNLARRLGLMRCAVFKKRAIQFGSRSTRQTNQDHFPSNRKATGVTPYVPQCIA